ncbi:MAG: alpha/beta hydrolase [Victivallaceae bacterium]|nr:alpha/beta hydrolase [Victivallaceae bacterium]
MPEPGKKISWCFILILAALAVTGLVIGRCSMDNIIFQPPRRAELPSGPGFTMLKTVSGVEIAALFLPVKNSSYWILYSHGNGEDLYDLHPYLTRLYNQYGYSAAFYDYEGYGRSDGRPGEAEVYRDIETVYKYMTGKMNLSPGKIIVLGRSVGSGPACYLAEKYPVAGLILESPFTSALSVVTSLPLPGDRFPNLDRIKKLKAPLLVIHGKKDRVIPFAHGRKLFNAAKGRKMFYEVPEAGHNNLLETAGEEYWDQLKKFTFQLERQMPKDAKYETRN